MIKPGLSAVVDDRRQSDGPVAGKLVREGGETDHIDDPSQASCQMGDRKQQEERRGKRKTTLGSQQHPAVPPWEIFLDGHSFANNNSHNIHQSSRTTTSSSVYL